MGDAGTAGLGPGPSGTSAASADTIRQRTTLPGRVTIELHGVLESTNSLARARAEDGAAAWTVIQAQTQSAGRGRHARDWQSPPGNLYCSTILRPAGPIAAWPQLSFVTALAVAEMASGFAPKARLSVKWPNDVLADGGKVSGILLETVLNGDGAVVVGTGVNVATHPEGTRYGATSLRALTGADVLLDAVTAEYLNALARWYDIWSVEGFARIRAAWTGIAHGLDREVLVDVGAGRRSRGRFRGIDDEGRMVIETHDGAVEHVAAGTVSFEDGGGT